MTPKEKAKDLIDKMSSISGYRRFSKGYALVCVTEIKEALLDHSTDLLELQGMDSTFRYWDDVEKYIFED